MSLDDYLYFIILPVLSISILLVFVRFVKGPTISDRVVAVDLLVTTGIGIIAVYSIPVSYTHLTLPTKRIV